MEGWEDQTSESETATRRSQGIGDCTRAEVGGERGSVLARCIKGKVAAGREGGREVGAACLFVRVWTNVRGLYANVFCY